MLNIKHSDKNKLRQSRLAYELTIQNLQSYNRHYQMYVAIIKNGHELSVHAISKNNIYKDIN